MERMNDTVIAKFAFLCLSYQLTTALQKLISLYIYSINLNYNFPCKRKNWPWILVCMKSYAVQLTIHMFVAFP